MNEKVVRLFGKVHAMGELLISRGCCLFITDESLSAKAFSKTLSRSWNLRATSAL